MSFNEELYKELLNKLENLNDKDFSSQKETILTFISDTIKDKKLARQISKLKYVENAINRVKERYNYLQNTTQKKESNEIQINKKLYVNSVRLILDKEICFRCDVSHTVCPKDAVSVERGTPGTEPKIEVHHEKCVLCGLCVPFCPSGCLNIFIDDEADILLETYQSLPILPELKEINGTPIKRLFTGNLVVNEEKCPERCEECVWSCPINVIERDGKHVRIDTEVCVLCGACATACPEDAITVKRNRILVDQDTGFSAAWTSVVGKLLGEEKINVDENARSMKKIRDFVNKIPELKGYTGNMQ